MDGCESDLKESRQIDYTDGERTAEAFSAPYTECSAKHNKGVEEVFELILIQLFKQEKRKRDNLIMEGSRNGSIIASHRDNNRV